MNTAARQKVPAVIGWTINVISVLNNWASSTHVFITSHIRVFDHGQHDLLPGLSRGGPEEDQEGLGEGLEVIVPVYGRPFLQGDLAKHLHRGPRSEHDQWQSGAQTHLHSYNSVDEEDEYDEESHPGKGLEGFDKSPEQGSYSLSFREKFD